MSVRRCQIGFKVYSAQVEIVLVVIDGLADCGLTCCSPIVVGCVNIVRCFTVNQVSGYFLKVVVSKGQVSCHS